MNPENCIQFRRHCDLAKAELCKLHDLINIAKSPGMVAALNRDQLEENINILEVNYMKVWNTGCLLREVVNTLIITLNSVQSEFCQEQDSVPLVSHDIPITSAHEPVEAISLPLKESTSPVSPEVSISSDTDAPLVKLPLTQEDEPSIKRKKDCVSKDVKETTLTNNLPVPTKSKLKDISEYNHAPETDTTESTVNRERVYEKIIKEILHPAPRLFTKKLTDTPTREQTMQNICSSQRIVVSDCNASISVSFSLASSNNVTAKTSTKRTFNNFQLSSQEGSMTHGVGNHSRLDLLGLSVSYAQNGIISSPLQIDSVPTMMLSSTPTIHSSTTLSNSNPAISFLGLSVGPHLQPPVADAGGPINSLAEKTTLSPVQEDVTSASMAKQSNSFALPTMWNSKGVPENGSKGTDTSQLQINSYDGIWGPGFITYYQQSDWPVGHNKSINNGDSVSLEVQAMAPSATSSPHPTLRCSQQCEALLPGSVNFPDPQFFIRGGLPPPYHLLDSTQAEWPTAFFASVCGAAPQTVYLDRHGMVSIYGGRDLPSDVQRTWLSRVHKVLYPWKGNGTPYSFQYETTISVSVGGVITCIQKVGLVRTLQQGLVLGRDFVESHTVWVERVDATSGWIHIDGHAFPCYRAKKAYKSLHCQQPVGSK